MNAATMLAWVSEFGLPEPYISVTSVGNVEPERVDQIAAELRRRGHVVEVLRKDDGSVTLEVKGDFGRMYFSVTAFSDETRAALRQKAA